MFGTVVTLPQPAAAPVANPLPRPRPLDASPRAAAEPAPVETKVEAKPADTAKLSDPMANLVVNALSYTPAPGEVTVRWTLGPSTGLQTATATAGSVGPVMVQAVAQ